MRRREIPSALIAGFLFALYAGSQLSAQQAAEVAKSESKSEDAADKEEKGKLQPVTLEAPDEVKAIFAEAPKDIEALMALQQQIREVTKRVIPCTVAVQLRGGMGSGVIISEDGYVLTAGHVGGRPDRDVTLILPDGRRVRGKTLGANYGIDSGLIKITEEGKWPYAEMGSSSKLRTGAWCFGTGHPGGFQRDRSPPVRLGRVLMKQRGAIITDCTLVGGDSGGPLFDLEGRVIGIHSRIGDGIRANIHVPVDTYQASWDRLVAGETWGGRLPGGPVIGVIADPDSEDAKIARVVPDSPAEEAGVKPGDVITHFDGKETPTFDALSEAVQKKEPGNKVKVAIDRDDEKLELDLIVGRWGG